MRTASNSDTWQHTQRRGRVLATCASWVLLLLLALSACSGPGSSNNPGSTQQTPLVTAVQTPPGPAIQCTSHSTNPVTLTMYYGSEKQEWIDDVVADFNSHHFAACDGPITVKATPIGSGQSMQQILDGTIQPDIWSPAGSVWLTLLNSQWLRKNRLEPDLHGGQRYAIAGQQSRRHRHVETDGAGAGLAEQAHRLG